jgi:HlyD family secretion protein
MNKHEPMANLVAKEQPVETQPSHQTDAPQTGDYPMPPKKLYFIVLILLGGLVAFGLHGHWQQAADASETQEETINFVPTVRTAAAVAQTKPVDLVLPGQTRAFDAASIFARATGYIAERRVDIGSRVKEGDLLVRIAAPDLDRQLDQSIAQLGQVKAALDQAHAQVHQADANLKLAQLNFNRSNALAPRGYDTYQNNDTQRANVATQQAALDAANAGVTVGEANIRAQQATVDRLRTLTDFEVVKAPFDGVITRRNIDIGDLVNADTGGGTPMFTMDNDNVLRVSVDIPQSASIGIHDGLDAKVTVPQLPGQVFTGKVARSSVALLSASRTLTTEVDVPNPDGRLRAGLFVNVTFAVPRDTPGVVVPAEALIFNQAGLQVAVVDSDNKVSLKSVTISRDFGKTVELRDGLAGGDRIVMSPPAVLRDGSKVKVAAEAPQSAPPQPAPPQKAEK